DPPVARRLGVRPHQELLELGDVAEAGPDLLARDDQLLALDHGARLETCQIGARVRLREPLTPDDVAAQDAREMERLLLLAAAGDERRPGVVQADERGRDLGGAGARVLLVPDHLLHEAGAAPAVLARPRDTGPAALEHASLPGEIVVPERPEIGPDGGALARHVRLEPGARVGPEGLFGSAEADLHRASDGPPMTSTRRSPRASRPAHVPAPRDRPASGGGRRSRRRARADGPPPGRIR